MSQSPSQNLIRMSNVQIGMLLFLFSESIFFIFLLVAYVNFHSDVGHLGMKIPMTHDLDVKKTAVYTLILVASSLTAWRAHRHAENQRFHRFHIWLGATILLGSAFLWGQADEYFRLFRKEITISRDPLSTGFFTVTGFHGLHVCVGVLLLTLVLLGSMVQSHRNRSLPQSSVEAISLYWHFVDVVWIGVFFVVYIWGSR